MASTGASVETLRRFIDKDDESETEDEEVKMNCIGGSRGIQDSDMNSDYGNGDEMSSDEDEDPYER